MEPLLFLCHRLPYPPDKGDKIRSFHELEHLARHYRVYLGTFIDDPNDEQHLAKVRNYCADLHVVRIDPRTRKFRSLSGLLTGEALGLPYYRDAGLAAWVQRTLAVANPQRVLVYSSTMAQYVLGHDFTGRRRVVDFVDVDSAKWRAYAGRKRWPLSWVYAREARCLAAFESRVAAAVEASVLVTPDEAALFRQLPGVPGARVHAVENGVDVDYFAPDAASVSPYPEHLPVVVFTGAMDYWANVDAVKWFAHAVWPAIRAATPAEFWIVGSRPAPEVLALAQLPGIRVTGRVPDIRPYLQHARLAVAPLRIARGVQNKVLEAMAMGLPVAGTPAAFEGLGAAAPGRAAATGDTGLLATLVSSALAAARVDGAGRDYVLKHHHWPTNLARLTALLEQH